MNSLPLEICHCLPKKQLDIPSEAAEYVYIDIWLCSRSQCSELLTRMEQHLYLHSMGNKVHPL